MRSWWPYNFACSTVNYKSFCLSLGLRTLLAASIPFKEGRARGEQAALVLLLLVHIFCVNLSSLAAIPSAGTP